jgi:hypothetical protein
MLFAYYMSSFEKKNPQDGYLIYFPITDIVPFRSPVKFIALHFTLHFAHFAARK